MRKLVTARRIIDIQPIQGADAIECATVDGWKVLVKKGEFLVGDLAMYFEIDSWIPESVAPFLCKDKREFNGVAGARLRTIRLRGQISQGLLLPPPFDVIEGEDYTEMMGVQKYEAPVAPQLAGTVRGNFPSFIPKTDQERIQNLSKELSEWRGSGLQWEVTEKLDGSSLTAYLYQGDFGVCSRNMDLKQDDANTFWATAQKEGLEEVLRSAGRNVALQGELIGPGIQGNKYELAAHEFHLFDIYDIDAGQYMNASQRMAFISGTSIKHVPVIEAAQHLSPEASCDGLLIGAEGKSFLNQQTEREGLVYKCLSAPISFKAISNKFLLSEK